MAKKDYEKICDSIGEISPFIRFVGIVGERGELLAYKRREDLVPLESRRSRVFLGRAKKGANNIICNQKNKGLGLN